MIEKTRLEIPADHPIRGFFKRLTERGMGHLNLHDSDTIQYITNLLTEFVQIENMYRIKDESGRRLQYVFEMLTHASNEMSPTFVGIATNTLAISHCLTSVSFPKISPTDIVQ